MTVPGLAIPRNFQLSKTIEQQVVTSLKTFQGSIAPTQANSFDKKAMKSMWGISNTHEGTAVLEVN